MARIFINVSGDGTASVDYPQITEGMSFTLTCTPFDGATLEDIRMWTSYDEAIACAVTPVQTIAYQSVWKNVYIDVYFSGAPVPPEPEPPFHLWWLIGKAAKRWRM